MARRSRWSSTSCSRPSSLTSNSTLPRSVLTVAGRSQTLATAWSSPLIAARRTADAATASAAAIANRADTPDRESTAGEARTSRVNRAMTWIRCSGSTAPGSVTEPSPSPQATWASWRIRASSASSETG